MKLTLEEIKELDKGQLTAEELMYLKLRLVFSVAKIAKYNGLSRQRVAQIIDGAIAKIEAQRNEKI